MSTWQAINLNDFVQAMTAWAVADDVVLRSDPDVAGAAVKEMYLDLYAKEFMLFACVVYDNRNDEQRRL